MIVTKYFSFYAEEISCLFKSKLLDYTGPGVCKWRAKKQFDVVRRQCHRSAGVIDFSTIGQNLSTSNVHMADDESNSCVDSSSDDDQPCRLYSEQRSIEYTNYGRKLRYRYRGKTDTFSVASYNVLAQGLLEMHPYLYRQCRRNDLKWSVRFSRLLRDFEFLNPDVLCLQEVEAQHLDDYFIKELGNMGYQGVYKKRTSDKIDGCAIFYKTSKFSLIELKTVELFVQNVKLLDRDNIGIVAMLAPKWQPEQRIVVATTHLLYTPGRSDIRLTQTQFMLAEIERMAYQKDLKTYCPIIYTGDMNYTPQSPIYELVKNGYVEYHLNIHRGRSYHGNKRILLPQSLGITDSCQFAATLNERYGNRCSNFVYGSGALDHHLRLESVYEHVKNNLVEASTYQDQWHTVDYIFFRRKSGRCKLELVSRLGLPNVQEAETDLGRLPNRMCASDHLPLIAKFHLSVSRC